MKPHLLVALLAGHALSGGAQPAPAASEPESARLAGELRTLIGPAACSSSAQCRTVAVGAKACGGPASYLPWSTQATDAQRVAALAAQQAEAQRRELADSGRRSHCALVTDPGAACVAGRCELLPAAAPR
jgi:hypothetical protein